MCNYLKASSTLLLLLFLAYIPAALSFSPPPAHFTLDHCTATSKGVLHKYSAGSTQCGICPKFTSPATAKQIQNAAKDITNPQCPLKFSNPPLTITCTTPAPKGVKWVCLYKQTFDNGEILL